MLYSSKKVKGLWIYKAQSEAFLQYLNACHILKKSENVQYMCCWVLRHFLTSQVIGIAFYSEREKSDKFSSEVLISAWGSFTCRKCTTRDPRLYCPSEGSHTQDFFYLENPSTPARFEPANLGSSGEYDNHGITGVSSFKSILILSFLLRLGIPYGSICHCSIWKLHL